MTCYTGYGIDSMATSPTCGATCSVSIEMGEILWQADVLPKLPETKFSSWMAEHGATGHRPPTAKHASSSAYGRARLRLAR